MRLPRPRALGVDVGSAVSLVGAVLKYLGAAFLFPAAIAVGEGEPVWPFLASGADHRGLRLCPRARNAREEGSSGRARVSSSSR